MRVLFSTSSAARYMQPPQLSDEQVNCGPDWSDSLASDGRVLSLATPTGEYDLSLIAAKLPPEQAPDVVVCLVDASWRNTPTNLGAFSCPKILLIADTHHLRSPLIGMVRYLAAEPFDRAVFLYDRHHAAFFHAAGFKNLFWYPGLTFPHDDKTVLAARKKKREARIAFVGQAGNFHPRRTRMLEAMKAAKLPVTQLAINQRAGLDFYGTSLIGFNASLNGDLNLRTFEILASGAALLTDRLTPESGLASLFPNGHELETYGDANELVTSASRLLKSPAETLAMGEAGARWFDANFSQTRRQEAFRSLVFDGVSPFAFEESQPNSAFFDGNVDRLLQGMMVYEGVQELHRNQESVVVSLGDDVPADFGVMCSTLPRVETKTGLVESDIAVFNREDSALTLNAKANRLWCWNAESGDFEFLAEVFSPGGFALASRDVAVLCRDEAPVAGVESEVLTDDRKHVLLYTDDPESGGVAQYNHTLIGGLIEAGYRVSCVQSRAENPLVIEQKEWGVRHHWLNFHTSREFARTVTDGSDAQRIFSTDRPDLVIFSDCCPVSNLAARSVAEELKIPFLVVVGFVGEYLARNFSAQLPVLARHYASARAVVAVSQENLDLLHNRFGLPTEAGLVIHYGRPKKFFEPRDAEVRIKLRDELNLPEDAVICFTAARLAAVKGYRYQIEAARALVKLPGGNRVHFVWAGEGEQRPELERAIAAAGLDKQIHLLGHRWDMANWYDAADIFALPSDLEGMPLAIMEAMAKGLPVIATAVSGIPEELGDTGKLLPAAARDRAGLVSQLAKTLHQWALNPALREELGQKARTRADTMFREELMLLRTLALVNQEQGGTRNELPVLEAAV